MRLRHCVIAISFSMSFAMSSMTGVILESQAARARMSSISLPALVTRGAFECRGDFYGAGYNNSSDRGVSLSSSVALSATDATGTWRCQTDDNCRAIRSPLQPGFLGGRLYDCDGEHSSAGPSKSCVSGAACGARISKVRP
jgi:hypothetical protein